MVRRRYLLGLVLTLAASTPLRSAERLPDPAMLVAAVDRMRSPAIDDARIELKLTAVTSQGSRTYAYTLLTHAKGQDSLVLAEDGDQKGQKYLSTAQGYWFYAPRTHQAIRLSPLQVLRGQASIGDVARLRFSDDYTVRFADRAEDTVDGRAVWTLQLDARSPHSTYHAVTLWVAKADGTPVRADLMAISGRKLKSLVFGPPSGEGDGRRVAAVTYVDAIDTTRRTTVAMVSVQPARTEPRKFRPESLSED